MNSRVPWHRRPDQRRPDQRSSFRVISTVVVLAMASVCPVGRAEPKLNRIDTPVVAVGQTRTVAADGTFANWPADVHVFPATGLEVKCLEKKGQLQLTATDSCPTGRYWLRFSDETGWSAPRPILVLRGNVDVESTSNDSIKQLAASGTTTLSLPAILAGRLEKNGDVDCFPIAVVANQPLTVAVTSSEVFGAPTDCVVQVVSDDGFVLTQNDDRRNLDPLLRWTPATDGRVWIRLFCFPATPNSSIRFAGGNDYDYVIEATQRPFLDFALPLAASRDTKTVRPMGWGTLADTAPLLADESKLGTALWVSSESSGWFQPRVGDATAAVFTESLEGASVELPVDLSGHLENDGDVDTIQIDVRKGVSYQVQVQSRAFGLDTDPKLSIVAPDGTTLLTADDIARDQRDILQTWKARSDGPARIEVRDAHDRGGARYGYRLTVHELKPALKMTAAKDWIVTSEQGATFDVELAWVNGLDAALELQALADDGQVVATANLSAKAKKVSLKLPQQSGQWKPLTLQVVIDDSATSRLRFEQAGLSSDVVWVR